ncbi:glycosyltransferase family 4 protein, partial [Klebsiella quasipneumoniae]|uniref:glycosyltransferase family 4 protein n=1 Tax=Klebsiella quasipneumoniae TaxID=1463165 RepID=UPI001F4A4D7D
IEAIVKSNVKTKLKIIGEASGNFQVTKNSNLDSRVEFLGRVDDKSLIELYQNADLFVFPSFYEGFGIPPLEAQSCGCPVVSSNRASLPEVLEQSVIYFNPENADEIILAITKVLEKSDMADELTERGLKNVQRFSWRKSATDLIKAIMLVNKNSINS